jgi:uncharacterized membrane protein
MLGVEDDFVREIQLGVERGEFAYVLLILSISQ